jgi:uncharacterized protein YdbL (DUF1318 family)
MRSLILAFSLPILMLALSQGGCITAPDVVVIDRKTALERQAAGQFPELEEDLTALGLKPGVEPFTRAQLQSGGWGAAWGALGELVQIYGAVRDDRARLDDHLRRACLGESRTGLLVATPDSCQGGAQEEEVAGLVARGNRNRRQTWRWMADRTSDATPEAIAAKWRVVRLRAVPCEGWVQGADGGWSAKVCK